jgi:hypothetical protein
MSFIFSQLAGGSQTYKDAVVTASSANVLLTGATPLSIGGVTVADKDRVLLKNQLTGSQNGIYVVTISGGTYTLTRALDANVSNEIRPNMLVPVQQGTYADKIFQLITNGPITLGVTTLDFDFAVIYDHGLLVGLGDDDHTQYHTDGRALTWLGTRSTADLPENPSGLTNLYYTTARVQNDAAKRDLSNLTSTAVNQDLVFNKASEAIINGSDSKATQANHNLTLRAGNSGSAVAGGHLYLQSGTSGSDNGGNIYIQNLGNTIAGRGIYFRSSGASDQLVIDNNGGYLGTVIRAGASFGFTSDNAYDIGSYTQGQRPRYVLVGTAIQTGLSAGTGDISGFERLDGDASAAGSLLVRGGNAGASGTWGSSNAGTLTLRGGDHPGNNTALPGNLILRGGNKSAGNANGGNVTISGGTKSGTGTHGEIVLETAGAEALKVKNTGVTKLKAELSLKSLHAQVGVANTISVSAEDCYIGVDSSSVSKTVNLPGIIANSIPAGKMLIIKDEGGAATTNYISIAVTGSDTIDGQASESLVVNYESITLVCDGASKWFIV